MREIIFRGKREDNGEWVEGFYCPKPYSTFPCETSIFPSATINRVWQGVKVIPETIGQYTEMCDNNHDGIFEGDIVRCKQEKNEGICVVRWFNGAFVACPISGNLLEMTLHDYWLNDYDLVEIIGNEIDNPELLIGEK